MGNVWKDDNVCPNNIPVSSIPLGISVDICKKVEEIEVKIDNLYKFRWQIGGVLAVAVVVIGLLPSITSFLTPKPAPATIERTK